MKRFFLNRPWRVPAAIFASCLLVIAAAWALTFERIAFEREHAIEDTQRQNANLALAFEEHVVRTMKGVDQALLFIRHEYRQHGMRIDLAQLARDGAVDQDVKKFFAVLDARGELVLNSRPFRRTSMADREFFQRHRDDPNAGLLISRVTIGRLTGEPTIHITRRLDNKDGSFAGVAIVGVDPAYFAGFYNNVSLGAEGLVMLVGTDGWLRAMRHTGSASMDPDMRAGTLFRELKARSSGDYVTTGRLDGLQRYTSFRTVAGYPLVVAVATSQRDALHAFEEHRHHYTAFAALATLVVAFFGAILVIAANRRMRAEAAVLDKNVRLATQQDALSGLAKGEVLHGMAEDEAMRRLTEVAADTLGIERVSYWKLDAERNAIECFDLFERSARRHSAGARLAAADYPRYFAALQHDEVIAAVDAYTDPRTSEFSAGYLRPLGIGAMLDVPVFVNGRPAGVLCHESLGAPRDWQQDEQLFATAVGGMLALTLERAERKRAESERAAVALRNGALVEALGEIAYDWWPAEDKLLWEGEYTRVLGYAAEEIGNNGASWLDRVHPNDLDRVKAELDEVIRTGRNYQLEYRFRHQDGSYRLMHDSGVPFFAADGSLQRIVGLFTDVTERRNEERLVQMEHDITRCLADAESVPAGLQCTLATLCDAQGWSAARYYVVDEEAGVLRCQESWSVADAGYEQLNTQSRGLTFPRGVGIAGLVWESGEPIWVRDVSRDPRVVNTALVRSAVQSAFVFPVLAQGKTIGVIATFGREAREPERRLLQAARSIGAQLGQFIERKRAQERAVHLAQFDTVTGLPNRVLCQDRLGQALSQAQRKQWSVGVLFVDLDRFKQVNDSLGHSVGDELLRAAGERLARCVRGGDTVARLGGDEFAVVLAELANPEHAEIVADKVIDAMSAPFVVGAQEVFVTASIGIATYPADGSDGEALLRNADVAMFRAKELGRNTFQFYTAAMNERAMEKLLLGNDLRRALARNEFFLHYQPKISLRSGSVTGVEALLRWQRPGNGPVSPGVFVPVLEETGLIVPVGDWIIDAACAQLALWRSRGLQPVPVAINLSAKQFMQHDIAAVIQRALAAHRVAGSLLEVEITESDAMQNPQEVSAILARLKRIGVRISIDDFGTGYSSLGYLKRFPLDALKLDRSFVTGLPASTDDASIALAVLGMAHSLGLKVVAEGVETAEQRDFLAAQGCDEMQGYLFSRPVPAQECARFLAPVACREAA